MRNSTNKPSGDGLPPSRQLVIMFRLAYLQRVCDQILAAVTATPVQPGPTASPLLDRTARERLKEWLAEAELLHRLWQVYRLGPWGMLGWGLFVAAKWLGVL